MIYYEVQGKRIPSEPKFEAQHRLENKPPNAELIVWEDNEIIELTTVEDKLAELNPLEL